MNLSLVNQVLKTAGFKKIAESSDQFKLSCPYAMFDDSIHKHGDKNPSFSIYPQKGATGEWHEVGYCHGCGNGNELVAMLYECACMAKAQGLPFDRYYKAIATYSESFVNSEETTYGMINSPVSEAFEPFPDKWIDSFPKIAKSGVAIQYLLKRGVTLDTVEKLNLRFDFSRNMIFFPYWNAMGQIAGARGRNIDDGASFRHYDYSYADINNCKLVFFGEHSIDYSLPVCVVEGTFDYARLYPHYSNVLALLTMGASGEKLKLLAKSAGVIWISDADAAGTKGKNKARKYYSTTAVKFVEVNIPAGYVDYKGDAVKDVGGLPDPVIAALIDDALKQFL